MSASFTETSSSATSNGSEEAEGERPGYSSLKDVVLFPLAMEAGGKPSESWFKLWETLMLMLAMGPPAPVASALLRLKTTAALHE